MSEVIKVGGDLNTSHRLNFTIIPGVRITESPLSPLLRTDRKIVLPINVFVVPLVPGMHALVPL